jgi:hypothetical protein
MGNKFRGGNSYKAQYQGYKIEGRWRKNKLAKLTKRALANEKDTQALDIFEKGSKEYGRQKPGKKGWFQPQEAKLVSTINSSLADSDTTELRRKLDKLREIHADTRPSAVRMKLAQPELAPLVVDQFLAQGLINAKRHKSVKQSLGRIRRR